MNSPTNKTMYPMVKVRHQVHRKKEDDHDHYRDVRNPGLKVFISKSSQSSPSRSPSRSPAYTPSPLVVRKKDVTKPSIVKAPKCYLSPLSSPRVQITESFLDCSLSSDSGSTVPEKDDSVDENKTNTRASRVPRPRAVISSPYNDRLIGNRNETNNGSSSPLKNGTSPQNRHAHRKVKSHEVADTSIDTRKSKDPGSDGKIDPPGKKKVHKGSTKSENVNRIWRF